VIVFASAISGAVLRFYMKGSLVDFLNIVTENKTPNLEATQIFTGEPGF